MLYEVYIDVFFAVNALLNLPVLILVKRLQRYKSSKWRILLAAMAGSSVLSVMLCLPVRRYLIVRLAAFAGAYMAMARIAFPDNKGKEWLRCVMALYLTGIVMNGIFRWMSLKMEHVPQLLAGCVAVYLAAGGSIRIFEKLRSSDEELYEVCIRYRGYDISLRGLWDTGNRLCSPYHHRGISVVNYDSIREYMSEYMKACMETADGITDLKGDEAVYYVPYETVSQKHGLLLVVQADKMWIHREKGTLEYKNPLLGISRLPVSSCGTFQIILTTNG